MAFRNEALVHLMLIRTLWLVLCWTLCRDKVVSRFERCRTQFADVSDMWLAVASSVELLGTAANDATLQAASGYQSGIDRSTSPCSSRRTRSPQLAGPPTSSKDTGIGTSASVDTAENSESPEVKLRRLERLKEHLMKYIQRFKPDELLPSHQCTCETERW